MDQAGGLWAEGKLVDKVVSGFTSAQNPHGGRSRRSSPSTRACTTGAASS